MSKLSTKQRAGMDDKDFALPGHRFPIEDHNHQEAALSGASRAEHAGNITATQEAEIDRKAEARLDKHPTRIAIRKAAAKVGRPS